MNLQVYEKDDSPNPVRLALVQDGDNVDLAVVDGNGLPEYYLLRIGCDGKIHRWGGVLARYGFVLDPAGRVQIGNDV